MSVATERAALFAEGLDIVTRERWMARQSYLSPRPVEKARWLFLHVAVIVPSGGEAQDCRLIEQIGQDRFKIGCSYNAAAFRSGRLYEMQPLRRRGAHTVNDKPNRAFPYHPDGRPYALNHLARALVLPQNVEHEVTDQQLDAAARWGAALCRAGFAYEGAEWFGHRDVTDKSCPGPNGYARLPELNRLTRHYERVGLVPQPPEDDDMAAGSLIKTADDPRWWLSDGFKRRHIKDRVEAGQLAFAGIARWNDGKPFPVTDEVLERIPVDT